MKKVLLVIDIQNDYFPGGEMELYEANKAVNQAALLLMNFRMKDQSIIFLQHVAGEESSFFKPDTHGVELHDMARPLPSEPVIQKSFPNGFRNTQLLELLNNMEIKELVICGMMTHMCVDTTVRAAFDLGFKCKVISDACATKTLGFDETLVHAREVQAAFLASLNGSFAKVLSLREYENSAS